MKYKIKKNFKLILFLSLIFFNSKLYSIKRNLFIIILNNTKFRKSNSGKIYYYLETRKNEICYFKRPISDNKNKFGVNIENINPRLFDIKKKKNKKWWR